MILQALVEHYEDLLKQGRIAKLGWGKVKVSYGLNLDRQGHVLGLIPLKVAQETGGSKKKTVFVARMMEVPHPEKRSVAVCPNFLCDNATYILGVDEKGKPERTSQCYEACMEKHMELLSDIHTPAAEAICHYFEYWSPDAARQCTDIEDNWSDLMAGVNLLFYYEGEAVTEDPAIREAWQQFYDRKDESGQTLCLVTGKKDKLAVLHSSIKGVRGAQAMGASLVSFNAASFCSYEKEQGANAPVGEYAAFAYTTALNELLNDRAHTGTIGDTTVVCWAEGGESLYQDVGMMAMFGLTDESGMTDGELRAIIGKVANGEPVQIEDIRLDPDRHFYVLGLAPNAARLTVRFFMRDSFGTMIRHVNEHQERLRIVNARQKEYPIIPIWKLMSETVNQNARDKSPSPQMAADTLKAVLTGGKYPASLLNAVMLRIRAEHRITRERAAMIKAYYLKNENKDCPKEVLQEMINEESKNVPYTLGRLFAVLEHLQQEANPGINTTIKDKYFNSAAATPAQIFPLLLNLAQKHLRKLANEGHKVYFNRQIGKLAEVIGESFPKRLNLPEQGAFQLGYYCQTQKRYTKKEEN
ncbi:MAG: type I-C CRISPR-associated protein Cas8c/Csd1 [Roseburia hominis]